VGGNIDRLSRRLVPECANVAVAEKEMPMTQMKTTMTNPSAVELREIASQANVEINYEFGEPHCAISQQDVLALADEIETLRAALKVAQQSLLEFSHAQECGPSWYTCGANGMYSQVSMHLRRGLEAVQGALGPYDDNGQYLKERPAADPVVHPCGYFSCMLPAGHDGVHQFPNQPAAKSADEPS
jgi:hypothetical protein